MSVIVKNMRMPETCIQCPMQFGGWCYVSPPEIDERVAPTVDEAWEQKKPKWCPLEEQTSGSDLITRETAIDALAGIIDRFERILADIRESKVDETVCGMCEYDGAYIGQSGDWFNECPGFDKDNCFKLSDSCRKRWMGDIALPSAQPEQRWIPCSDGIPKRTGYYICTCRDGVRYITSVLKWQTGWVLTGARSYWKVIAWMPLPAPFESKESEAEG